MALAAAAEAATAFSTDVILTLNVLFLHEQNKLQTAVLAHNIKYFINISEQVRMLCIKAAADTKDTHALRSRHANSCTHCRYTQLTR